MTVPPIPSRLDFVAEARRAMDFLTEPPYNLWLASQDEELVVYEGVDFEVLVLHDRQSYELDIAVARLSHEEEVQRPFGMADLMSEIRPDSPIDRRGYRSIAATTAAAVQRGIGGLVSEFRRVVPRLIDPSNDIWRNLSEKRSEAVQTFGEEVVHRQTRQRAIRAWERRDYRTVIDAYSSMSDALSDVERERLRFSQERASGL